LTLHRIPRVLATALVAAAGAVLPQLTTASAVSSPPADQVETYTVIGYPSTGGEIDCTVQNKLLIRPTQSATAPLGQVTTLTASTAVSCNHTLAQIFVSIDLDNDTGCGGGNAYSVSSLSPAACVHTYPPIGLHTAHYRVYLKYPAVPELVPSQCTSYPQDPATNTRPVGCDSDLRDLTY